MIKADTDIGRNESIKIWRVLSCVGVLSTHLGQEIHLDGNIWAFTDFGQYGVYLFFIISGYLACFSQELQNGDVLAYWYKRAIRLLPLYYFVIIIYFIAETYIFKTVPVDDTGLGWLRYFLLLFGFIKSDVYFWYNIGFTWTIPVFLIFYLLAPLCLRVIKNFWQSWLIAVFLAMISYVIKVQGGGYFSACTYLYFFAYGIMVYYCEREKKEREVIFIVSVLLIGFLVFVNPVNVIISYYANIYALIMILLLVSTLGVKISNRKLQRIIDNLDKYTYTIYLVQGVVFVEIIGKYDLSNGKKILVGILGTGVLAYAVYNFYEKPVYNMLKKLKIRKSKQQGDSI